MNRTFFIILIGIIIIFPGWLTAQLSGNLKEFLWQKNFFEIIENYAEDKIVLEDPGFWQKQISQRSYTEEMGYRIQVFAGAMEENARSTAASVEALALDSVYVIEQNTLFKVQLGNFQERLEAEKMLDQLRFKGITNAWIVQTTIHVPKKLSPMLVSEAGSDSTIPSPIVFTIQLFVTSDLTKAQNILESLKNTLGQDGWVIRAGEFWKVVVGSFEEETAAREALSVIRSSGYPDAWVTQFKKEDQ